MLYRIKDYAEHYETAESRKIDVLNWVPIKTSHDSIRFRRLMKMPNGAAIFAVFILMVQIAAKLPKSRRNGNLISGREPLTAEDISVLTDVPEPLILDAIEVLTSPKIGWLEIVEIEANPDEPGSDPGVPGDDPGQPLTDKIRGEEKREEEKRGERKKELQAAPKKEIPLSAVPPDAAAAFPDKFGEEVKAVSVEVMDPGGAIAIRPQNTHHGPVGCRQDCRDMARKIVWCKLKLGHKVKTPFGLAADLTRKFMMSLEDFQDGIEEQTNYIVAVEEQKLLARKKAEEIRCAEKKRAALELEQAENHAKDRQYLDLLEKFDELPEFDRKAIESFAVEAFRDDGNHYQPPAIKSLPMRPYFLEAFKAHMGVFE